MLGSSFSGSNESAGEGNRKLRGKNSSKWKVLLDAPLVTKRFPAQALQLIDGREAAFYLRPVEDAIRDLCMKRPPCRSNAEALIRELAQHGRGFAFFTHPELNGQGLELSDPVHVRHPDRILRHIVAELFAAGPDPEAITYRRSQQN